MNAGERDAIEAALRQAGVGGEIIESRDLSGGCIHRVRFVSLDDGTKYVAKVNTRTTLGLFEEEAVGLRCLAATRTVITPTPLATVTAGDFAILLMPYLEPPAAPIDATCWSRFGAQLAALHRAPLPNDLKIGYGFSIDNHLGSTPQPNGWLTDWVEFNAIHRLGHQVRLACDRGLMNSGETGVIEAVIARLDGILPRNPRPSLLHGDLWSGNILPARTLFGSHQSSAAVAEVAVLAVIDPAPSVGDALADIAMMRLFGGIAEPCFDAWGEAMQVDCRSAESRRRIAAYQLYHVLNHVNIFGRGYLAQAIALARGL